MTDKKFTDEEIIKGLTELSQYTGLQIKYTQALKAGLDLINRQKAEIEKLNIQLQGLWNMAGLYKAESERWESYNENLLTANTALSNEILESKTKAYKEFVERLKSYLLLNKKGEMSVISFENVDNLLKEMVGEEECEI